MTRFRVMIIDRSFLHGNLGKNGVVPHGREMEIVGLIMSHYISGVQKDAMFVLNLNTRNESNVAKVGIGEFSRYLSVNAPTGMFGTEDDWRWIIGDAMRAVGIYEQDQHKHLLKLIAFGLKALYDLIEGGTERHVRPTLGRVKRKGKKA